jgi:hypothetical protein
VAFVWLFGGLEELPFHFPQLCLDIKQWAIELGDPELPHQKESRHHALADARWTKEAWGVSRKPRSRRSRPPHYRTQEPRPSRRWSSCRFVCAEDKPSMTAAADAALSLCAQKGRR